MPPPSEIPRYNPNVFSRLYPWYSDTRLDLTEPEQAVVAESAARYEQFAPLIGSLALATHRQITGDPAPLGEDTGIDSIAYQLQADNKLYVVRFSKGFDPEENVETVKLRVRNLARARAFQIPHLEYLTAHSVMDDAVVTEWASGTPADELSPDDILAIPDDVLTSLRETATKMETAGLALDIMWGASGIEFEEPLDKVIAHYDSTKGPTYFDLVNREEDPSRVNEAGLHYAQLLTSMVATNAPLDPTAFRFSRLTLPEVTSRLHLLDRGYRTLRKTWRLSTGADWLERTAGRMVQTLPPPEHALVMSRVEKYAIPINYRQEY
jgi:hypothetical protein